MTRLTLAFGIYLMTPFQVKLIGTNLWGWSDSVLESGAGKKLFYEDLT